MIPQELNITIDKALKMNPELRKSYESDEQVKYLIDMSRRLEGLPRHSSMHVAALSSVRSRWMNMYRFPAHPTVRSQPSLR